MFLECLEATCRRLALQQTVIPASCGLIWELVPWCSQSSVPPLGVPRSMTMTGPRGALLFGALLFLYLMAKPSDRCIRVVSYCLQARANTAIWAPPTKGAITQGDTKERFLQQLNPVLDGLRHHPTDGPSMRTDL